MLNLKTKGIENAAAVLGGYDALVKAGFPTETGKHNSQPAPPPPPPVAAAGPPAASAGAASIKPPQAAAAPAHVSQPTQAKRASKRRKAKH